MLSVEATEGVAIIEVAEGGAISCMQWRQLSEVLSSEVAKGGAAIGGS